MRALLDVNVLIALLDAGHVHHPAATAWLVENGQLGWASCPITQNGCVRILSSSAYARHQPVSEVIARLSRATRTPFHEFWTDDVSVLDPQLFDESRWISSRQVTDAYLLALAVRRGGAFVTLDRGIDQRLVRGAEARHIIVI